MTETGLLDIARQFRLDTIAPQAQDWEKARVQPVAALREAGQVGLLSFEVPAEFGGLGASFQLKQAVCEELSRADMAFTFAMVNTQNIAAKLALSDNPRRYTGLISELMSGELFGATALSEPGAGSDFSGISTTAEQTADGWILNGTKGWITNTAIADIFIVYAQTSPDAGWRGIASFLVDARAPGFERGDIYQLMGGHAIGAGEFHLRNYAVDAPDMLSPPGEAFKQAMALVNGARTYVASMCCGMVADALNRALTYSGGRMAFGQPVLNNQGLMWSLADVFTDLEALRVLTDKAGRIIDAGEDPTLAAAVAKKYAGRVTVPAITACIQAMGANGLREDNTLGRHLACAKIAAYTDGSTEMMNERIGASLRAGISKPAIRDEVFP
jgi:alkylation response protein AidB-like acyl-CoA dehydrogenase